MTELDQQVVRRIVREEFQVMIDLSVAQQLAKLKDEVKRDVMHDLNQHARLRVGNRNLETK